MALSVLPALFQNLNFLIQKEFGLLWGVDKEMKKLSSTLSAIQSVIEDAEEKQFRDKAVRDWLQKLKYAAFELDDILDDCSTETLKWEYKHHSSGSLKKVSTSFLTCYPVQNVLFRHKIGTRMKEIIENLSAIADERNKFHLRETVAEEKGIELAKRRETSSLLTQPQLYGRDEDREKIVKVLVKDVCDREGEVVSVYPIVGMGGLGKTTLAQMVFNDERVKCHFEPRIWVYVSQDFDTKRLIKATIESASGNPCKALDLLDSLQRRLQGELNRKRYLIVLDDVWNEDPEEWDKLKSALACGAKGASLIVTTRLENVASIMRTIPSHHLSFLSEDDCWLLFRQRAFGHENEERPNLVAIGKEIVKKCGGVPLAAKVLGGLLHLKSEEKDWICVRESEIWNLPQNENSILPALRLSYFNLSLELRRCFAYCAIFSKGMEIEKRDLIHQWMANGYISCEDKGEEIWNKLFQIFFFEVVDIMKYSFDLLGKNEAQDFLIRNRNYEMYEIGCTTWFKMHDLVHDLAQIVMEDECQIIWTERSIMPNKKVRCVSSSMLQEENQAARFLFRSDKFDFNKFGSLRVVHGEGSRMMNSKFGSFRVVHGRGSRMMNLTSSIGNLKHLRFLDLSGTLIKQLPDAICSLWNLQTLILDDCVELKRLPKNMNHLRGLRHLYLRDCPLIGMPPKIGRLTCLKTLSLFVVGKSIGCHLTEMQCLNLGGKLRIEHLERVRNPTHAKDANLMGKQNLTWLELAWGHIGGYKSQENVEELLEALEPHANLKGLVIENYEGIHLPFWMRNSILGNIVIIKLIDCKNCSQLPPLGQLPLLRRVKIDNMDKLEYIDNDLPGDGEVSVRRFPSLEVLKIISLPNLKGLSREEGKEFFPRLHKIVVRNCPKLRFPCLLSPKDLRVRGGCNNVVLNSVSNLNSLTSLSVTENEEAICFPEELLRNLTHLESLSIHDFSKLQMFPDDLASLIALKSLAIDNCLVLESLPVEGLRSLGSLLNLEISGCCKLSSLSEGLGHLTSLETLDISECPELVAFPDGVKHLNSLQHLSLDGGMNWHTDILEKSVPLLEGLQYIPALQSLWISSYGIASLPDWLGNLTSLQMLSIYNCHNLVSLPTSIQSLTQLKTLEITKCPKLKKQCLKETGDDWYKIAHIPEICITDD